jgi:hypothetical protein
MHADLPSAVAGLFEDALSRAEANNDAGEGTSVAAGSHGLAGGGRTRQRRRRDVTPTEQPAEADAQLQTDALALARAEVAEESAKARARAHEEADARRRAKEAEREQILEREAEAARVRAEAVRVKLASATRSAEQRWACIMLGIKQRVWRVWWRAMSEAKMQESVLLLPSARRHTPKCAATQIGGSICHPHGCGSP